METPAIETPKFLLDRLINSLLLEEAEKIEALAKIHQIPLCRIKGARLIGESVLSSDSRSLSDIDYLIPSDQLDFFDNLLVRLGYVRQIQSKWFANRHRCAYFRALHPGLVLSIDLHTKLFWNSDDLARLPLSNSEHVLYMIFNWGYQDGFIGSYKFDDLELIFKEFNEVDQLLVLAKAHNLLSVTTATLMHFSRILNRPELSVRLSSWRARRILRVLSDSDFLANPKRYKLKYFLTKIWVRESLWEFTRYLAAWVWTYGKAVLFGGLRACL